MSLGGVELLKSERGLVGVGIRVGREAMPSSAADDRSATMALRLLGPVIVQIAGPHGTRRVALPRVAQAMIGYIAAQPNWIVSREHLAWLLWSDVSDAQSRQNLRQALLRLKRELAGLGVDALLLDDKAVRLDDRLVRTDLLTFLAGAESSDPKAVAAALGAYRGGFLEGLHTGRDAFDDWLRGERARIERMAHQAMRELADWKHRDGDGLGAVELYERLMIQDPLNEEVQRLLIGALALAKGPQAALSRGEAIADTMRKELGCGLDQRTLKLLADIRRTGAPVSEPAAAKPRSSLPSVVVLPFDKSGMASSQEYLADGLAEDITTGLSRLKWLFVLSRNAAQRYGGQQADPALLGRELGVTYALSGSMRVAGDRLRVTVALIDAATGQQLWTQRYDRLLVDVFAVQDEITDRVLALIEPSLYAAEGRRTASIPPESLDAWGLVVQSIDLIHRFERQPNDQARALLERAIALEPHYARAHAVLSWAECWARDLYWIRDRERAYQSSLDHAEIALRLDPAEPWSHMVLGFARSNLSHHGRALDALNTAVDLNPNFALARMLRGWAMVRAGRFDDAIAETAYALQLMPSDRFGSVYRAVHGLALLAAHRFEEALPHLRAAVTPVTDYWGHCNMLVSCCGHLGHLEEARRWLARREKALGRVLQLGNAAAAVKGYAHAETFLEGLAKAGVR